MVNNGQSIFDVDNGQIIKEEVILDPGHKPGFLPNFLHEKGVTVIISGGMGGGAIAIFDQKNIAVVTGASGSVTEAACASLRVNWRQQALYVTSMRTIKNAVSTNYTCHDYGKFLWERSAVVLPQCFLVALHIKLAMGLNHVEYIT